MNKVIEPARGKKEINLRFPTTESYTSHVRSLISKVESKIPLTLEEELDFCRFTRRTYNESYTFCEDVHFISDYLDFHWKETKVKSIDFPLRKIIKKYYKEWRPLVYKLNHKDEILNLTTKETRDCIKLFINENKPSRHKKGEINIVLLSRFIYIKIYRVFKPIGKNYIEVINNGITFHIDPFTLAHTLFRHYVPEIEKFGSKKSYFNKNIFYDQIAEHLQYIFFSMENNNYKLLNTKDIKIEYNGIKYQIYTKSVGKSFTEIGNIFVNRINTFYLITDLTEISKLNNLNKNQIADDVAIYE